VETEILGNDRPIGELIRTVKDQKRGCGWRQGGGLYMVVQEDFSGFSCGRLPFELTVCPTCSAGIKPSRSWTWINTPQLLGGAGVAIEPKSCPYCNGLGVETAGGEQYDCLSCVEGIIERSQKCRRSFCDGCALGGAAEPRTGLLWIGEKFYPTPDAFLAEARTQGISRRLPAVPNDFVCGRTWVLTAHRLGTKAACPLGPGTHPLDCPECEGRGYVDRPAIFAGFRPERIEYVIKGTESEKQLRDMIRRGIQPVRVERVRDDGSPIPPGQYDSDVDDE